jgi:hypothetical protein
LIICFFWTTPVLTKKRIMPPRLEGPNTSEDLYLRSWGVYRDNRLECFFLLGVYVLSAIDAYTKSLFDSTSAKALHLN